MPFLKPEYMRLVFLEKEFDDKCAWANVLSEEVDGLHADRAALTEEYRRLAEERERLTKEVGKLQQRIIPYRVRQMWRRLRGKC